MGRPFGPEMNRVLVKDVRANSSHGFVVESICASLLWIGNQTDLIELRVFGSRGAWHQSLRSWVDERISGSSSGVQSLRSWEENSMPGSIEVEGTVLFRWFINPDEPAGWLNIPYRPRLVLNESSASKAFLVQCDVWPQPYMWSVPGAIQCKSAGLMLTQLIASAFDLLSHFFVRDPDGFAMLAVVESGLQDQERLLCC
ncbi:hypothetical protein NPIL_118041 [Nephila pilipes]|uniref:Uncharacterized protein n=1 Tax=Nephila pilipes TaxID=299642 RepID=A0A8X6MRU5_NEPPI|nr:hypothetical protein NPIL_118041 [Nephila pilipes]